MQIFYKQKKYLDKTEIINKEFLCPFWVLGAIKRQEVVILEEKEKILWAIRFYKRKKENIISLYQFAFLESLKNRKVLAKMLEFISWEIFETECFLDSETEKFLQNQDFKYYKTKWKIAFYRFNKQKW